MKIGWFSCDQNIHHIGSRELPTRILLFGKLTRNFCDDIPINHIPAAGNNTVVRINVVVLQLLMLSCIIILRQILIKRISMIRVS
jgi:hypothetical protein